MEKCLAEAGLSKLVFVDFYDSRRIADWAALNPGVRIWIESALGITKSGWKPYGPWAYRLKDQNDQYLMDGNINIFRPQSNTQMTVQTTIDELRELLVGGGKSIRIVGLSGVGKTRLVQALFDDRVKTTVPALLPEQALYTDSTDNPNPYPSAMLEALMSNHGSSVVVVDNCGQELHNRLTGIVLRAGSSVSLITIEYDIRDDIPPDTSSYRLEGASNQIVAKLLRRHYPELSDLDISAIVQFSDGNSRVAFALASTSVSKGEFSQLRDSELFGRLFLQKNGDSHELRRCAEVASLLYSFDFDDDSEEGELALLASLANITRQAFRCNVVELFDRGLIQARGKWRAVLPHAIANRLAKDALEKNLPQSISNALLSRGTERTLKSFSRRLSYLHESKNAEHIATKWLVEDGPLRHIEALTEEQFQMLENIAPICQKKVLRLLCEFLKGEVPATISSTCIRRIARILRSLAYEEDNFDAAARGLWTLVEFENASNGSDSALEILRSLYWVCLSGTMAPPTQRKVFLESLIASVEERYSDTVLSILSEALATGDFSSSYSFEFGALKRTYGWYPANESDYILWYSTFIRMTGDLAAQRNLAGAKARKILGRALQHLCGDSTINDQLIEIASTLVQIDGWPDGWIGAREALASAKKSLSPEALEQIKSLEEILAPQDITGKIRTLVFSDSMNVVDADFDFNGEDAIREYETVNQAVESLGTAVALNPSSLVDLRSFIFCGTRTNRIFLFGRGMGRKLSNVAVFIGRLKMLFEESSDEPKDISFIVGLIEGWNSERPEEVNSFLDGALQDSVWAYYFPSLQIAAGLNSGTAFNRFSTSLAIARAPITAYSCLAWGRVTDELTVKQIGILLDRILQRDKEGIAVGFEIMRMVIHCSSEKDDDYQYCLQAYVAEMVSTLNWDRIEAMSENFNYNLVLSVEYAAHNGDPFQISKTMVSRLLSYSRRIGGRHASFLEKMFNIFFKERSTITLDLVFAESASISDGMFFFERPHRTGEAFLSAVPVQELLGWCVANPQDRCIFASRGCDLFVSDPDKSGEIRLSECALSILEMSSDKAAVMDVFCQRFMPWCWSGSRVEIMRQRARALEKCNRHNSAEIEDLLRRAKKYFDDVIVRQECLEQSQEGGMSGRFE